MVLQCGGDGGDGWQKVGHHEDDVGTSLSDGWDDGFHHEAVAEVDVHVRCGGEGNDVGGHCGESRESN